MSTLCLEKHLQTKPLLTTPGGGSCRQESCETVQIHPWYEWQRVCLWKHKKRRDPRGKNVTLKLWWARKTKFVYYESRKRELKKRLKNGYRYDERLKTRSEESTYLTYTGLREELEHLKVKTRLISAKIECCLSWIKKKARAKDKTYEWGSVWWETKS
jgi:hypothetical protein